jgi:hypothetical protein
MLNEIDKRLVNSLTSFAQLIANCSNELRSKISKPKISRIPINNESSFNVADFFKLSFKAFNSQSNRQVYKAVEESVEISQK